ncbi:VWA domain-containing protein [Thermodesulfobacteriota bacterium]
MKFARVEMLFFIWAVPALFLVFFYGMRKRRDILSRFSSTRGLEAIAPDADTTRRWIKAGLMLWGLLFVAIAISGPQYGFKWQEVEQKGVDIIIALDCSKSMMATDIQPTRLDRAKREVYDLLGMLEGDRVGLVAFAGTAFLQCPLTLDYGAFHLFLGALSPDFLPVGGTDIAGALNSAFSGFDDKKNTEKAVILITDGESTGGDHLKAAEAAQKAGIRVFCIGVGQDEGVPVPDSQGGFKKDISGKIVLTKLDEAMLKKIAVMTGGTYVRSMAGDMDLDVIYTNDIRGKMEMTTLSSGKKQIWEDRYQWFLSLAIAALMAELFLPAVRKVSAFGLLFLLLLSPSANAGDLTDGLDAYEKGNYESALEAFMDAQLDDPERSEILYNIGNAYYKLGDFNAANLSYQQALKTEKENLKQKAWYNLGNTHYRKGALEDAVKSYTAALEIDPDDAQARQNLEFVKKRMEQQKTEQQQKDDNSKEDKSGKKDDASQQNGPKSGPENPDEDQAGDGQTDQGESKKDSSAPEYGNEMNSAGNNDEKQPDLESENKQDQRRAEAGKTSPVVSTEDKKQAERLLNRLEDKPGGAMIPAYRDRHVEKDW